MVAIIRASPTTLLGACKSTNQAQTLLVTPSVKDPIKLVYQREFHFVEQAIAYEKQIKGWSRKKKEALISGDIDLLSKISSGR
jgi:predicted GIY-YIG superfamily endonuclease